jgi:hypothetical protein
MNSAWATSLDQLWRSQTFPMWLTLAAAGFFAVLLLVALLRAERSVANGALAVITLLAILIAVAATKRGFGSGGSAAFRDAGLSPKLNISMPALSCIDDLAGENVETACEKTLFGSAESAAAAVSYAADRLNLLVGLGDVAAAKRSMTPELDALRRSIERDRYGLIAYVLSARDRCKPSDCPAFQSLTDHNQVSANMDEHIYEGLILRYAPSWNAPAPAAPAIAALPQLPPGATGKPTTADFPSAASIPPVTIMTPEPVTPPASRTPPSAANAQSPAPRPATTVAASAPKKPPAPKARAVAPVQLAPAAPSADN